MIKIDGKFSSVLGSDIEHVLNSNIECTFKKEEDVLYVSRELTAEELRLINDLKFIEKSFPEDIYEGLRVGFENGIDEDTIGSTKIYSPYNIGSKCVLYYVPKGKRLLKKS